MKAGIGIVTYERPEAFETALRSVVNHETGADVVVVFDDGSSEEAYQLKLELCRHLEVPIFTAPNAGVATVKNRVLKYLMGAGCDYLFVMEDDVEVISDDVLTAYVDASEASGHQHLMFGRHGLLNRTGPIGNQGKISYFTHCVGAWCFYTRKAIETVGYFDENFVNAWEHVEHTSRLIDAGLTAPFWSFADVRDSDMYLREQFETPSVIGAQNKQHVTQQYLYWRDTLGTCPI